MKIFKIALLFSFFMLCACNERTEQKQANKLTVAVTLQPYAKILSQVGGERVDVVALIPSNADPHTFEPKPETLKNFAQASLYLSDGSGIDKNWKVRFLGVNPNVVESSISEGIVWNKLEEHHHEGIAEEHDENEVQELDPHLWTSPKVVKVIANNMRNALCKIDTAGCNDYSSNLEKYNFTIDSLDKRFIEVFKALKDQQKKFMVFHPSFGYLARDYGLTQLAVEVEGKEPKPRDLQSLIATAKENNVKTVFVMPQFSKRAAESIAKEIEGTVQTVDPLAYEFENVLKEFVETMKNNNE